MPATPKTMDAIVALCRRRGFIWQSSEIYGGINGFWDYGPLGAELKKNLKDAWWHDIVRCPGKGPDGHFIDMVGVDCTIIMHPKVWEASGHVAGFNDPMVDDKETKDRFRADHLWGLIITDAPGDAAFDLKMTVASMLRNGYTVVHYSFVAGSLGEVTDYVKTNPKELREFGKVDGDIVPHPFGVAVPYPKGKCGLIFPISVDEQKIHYLELPSPFTGKRGTLTEPRQFNLMFESHAGPIKDEANKVYLRPETAQGIFTQFWNVVDTSRVKVPFGIAQIGKAFRNEVTPRNFTFRSREFEQMEIEFFIRPEKANEWYKFWRDSRFAWWQSVGLAGENLQLREHDRDELAHYAKEGAGTSDIEYRFPFTAPGYGELEGVAHRTDFDLRQHANTCGKGDKLKYFDQELQVKLQNEGASKDEINAKSRYFPHVIEPSAGADRGTLALLCEAFTPDETRPSGVYMKFQPRIAPIKAGIFPLVNKDGMPEIAEKLYLELRQSWCVQFDEKQTIGKRYARMDEAGTPYCFTVDGETAGTQTVTVRHRDTQQQERVGLDKVGAFLKEKMSM
ncbi:MAG: glycine--tRNA ligase [Phycisphaeraceae bacterium]|nr:glycine--tRNA ligase [Phycisphaeraceae bacterium]